MFSTKRRVISFLLSSLLLISFLIGSTVPALAINMVDADTNVEVYIIVSKKLRTTAMTPFIFFREGDFEYVSGSVAWTLTPGSGNTTVAVNKTGDMTDVGSVGSVYDGKWGVRVNLGYSANVTLAVDEKIEVAKLTLKALKQADIDTIIGFNGNSTNFDVELRVVPLNGGIDPDPTYAVTVNSSVNGTVTANPSSDVKAGDPVTLTVTPDQGYELDTLTVNGEALVGTTFNMPDGNATVSATFKLIAPASAYTVTATGDAEVRVNEAFNVVVELTANPASNVYASAEAELTYNPSLVTPNLTELDGKVSHDGSGKLKITGGPTGGSQVGDKVILATIPFTSLTDTTGDAVFSVSNGAKVYLSGQDDTDTGIDAASGADLTVKIKAADSLFSFDTNYKGLPASGYLLLKYELEAAPTKVYTYNGNTMHYAKIGDKHYVTYIVADTVTAENAYTPVETATAYTVTADVNGQGGVRINDAQIVFDLVNGHDNYKALNGLSIQARLNADVNGDGVIDSADVNAVQYAVHHNGALPAAG